MKKLSLQEILQRSAYATYQHQLNQIPDKIDAYDLGVKLGKLWTKDKITNSRNWKIDRTTPYYLTLELSYNDELCREPQVFIQEVESMLGKDIHAVGNHPNVLQRLTINEFLVMAFTKGKNNTCELVEIQKQRIEDVVEYKTVCN